MRGRWLGRSLCLLALVGVAVVPAPASAQEAERLRTVESAPVELSAVIDVDLVAARFPYAPPVLVLLTKERKLRAADGTYRTRDRKSLVIRTGQLVELSDPEAKIRRFTVANIEKVAVRMAEKAPRLVLEDERGRTVVLPDGRFVSESEAVLDIRDGMIVGYGGGR